MYIILDGLWVSIQCDCFIGPGKVLYSLKKEKEKKEMKENKIKYINKYIKKERKKQRKKETKKER